jgi:hypothetical protein
MKPLPLRTVTGGFGDHLVPFFRRRFAKARAFRNDWHACCRSEYRLLCRHLHRPRGLALATPICLQGFHLFPVSGKSPFHPILSALAFIDVRQRRRVERGRPDKSGNGPRPPTPLSRGAVQMRMMGPGDRPAIGSIKTKLAMMTLRAPYRLYRLGHHSRAPAKPAPKVSYSLNCPWSSFNSCRSSRAEYIKYRLANGRIDAGQRATACSDTLKCFALTVPLHGSRRDSRLWPDEKHAGGERGAPPAALDGARFGGGPPRGVGHLHLKHRCANKTGTGSPRFRPRNRVANAFSETR